MSQFLRLPLVALFVLAMLGCSPPDHASKPPKATENAPSVSNGSDSAKVTKDAGDGSSANTGRATNPEETYVKLRAELDELTKLPKQDPEAKEKQYSADAGKAAWEKAAQSVGSRFMRQSLHLAISRGEITRETGIKPEHRDLLVNRAEELKPKDVPYTDNIRDKKQVTPERAEWSSLRLKSLVKFLACDPAAIAYLLGKKSTESERSLLESTIEAVLSTDYLEQKVRPLCPECHDPNRERKAEALRKSYERKLAIFQEMESILPGFWDRKAEELAKTQGDREFLKTVETSTALELRSMCDRLTQRLKSQNERLLRQGLDIEEIRQLTESIKVIEFRKSTVENELKSRARR